MSLPVLAKSSHNEEGFHGNLEGSLGGIYLKGFSQPSRQHKRDNARWQMTCVVIINVSCLFSV